MGVSISVGDRKGGRNDESKCWRKDGSLKRMMRMMMVVEMEGREEKEEECDDR
jgi:hypothetical protein